MCARYENFVVHLRTSRALSERFLSRWHDSVNSISSHTMSTLPEVFLCIYGINCSLGCKCIWTGDLFLRMCARYENFVVHLRTSRALSERFLSRWHDSVNSISSHTMSTLPKCSYAYRTVHWDVNLHLNRWSPSAHVCKVREFRGTSAHFQSTFRALFKQVTWLC